jgi:hypothetical protein
MVRCHAGTDTGNDDGVGKTAFQSIASGILNR